MDTKILDSIINQLEGSCDSLDSVLEHYNLEIEQLSMDDLCYIDEHIFCCESCGWWCNIEEVDDEWRCEDCHED